MSSKTPEKLPPGRQPYDPLNGLRVGGLAGGILGAVFAAASDLVGFWFVLVAAAIGAGIGYWTEKFKLSGEPPEPEEGAGPG